MQGGGLSWQGRGSGCLTLNDAGTLVSGPSFTVQSAHALCACLCMVCRGQYIVGLDAKYLYLPMTALPHRVTDFCYTCIFRAIPARLLKTHKAGNKLKAP